MSITEEPLSRVERRKLATRRALLAAGRELIAVRGIGELSVQAITEQADVALGTFYNYFDDKAGLYSAVLEDDWRAIEAAIARTHRPEDSPVTTLALLTAVGTARAWHDREFGAFCRGVHAAALFPDPDTAKIVAALHQRAVVSGALPGLAPALVGPTYFGLTIAHVGAIADGEHQPTLDSSVQAVVTVVLRAFGASRQVIAETLEHLRQRDPSSWWPASHNS